MIGLSYDETAAVNAITNTPRGILHWSTRHSLIQKQVDSQEELSQGPSSFPISHLHLTGTVLCSESYDPGDRTIFMAA